MKAIRNEALYKTSKARKALYKEETTNEVSRGRSYSTFAANFVRHRN